MSLSYHVVFYQANQTYSPQESSAHVKEYRHKAIKRPTYLQHPILIATKQAFVRRRDKALLDPSDPVASALEKEWSFRVENRNARPVYERHAIGCSLPGAWVSMAQRGVHADLDNLSFGTSSLR